MSPMIAVVVVVLIVLCLVLFISRWRNNPNGGSSYSDTNNLDSILTIDASISVGNDSPSVADSSSSDSGSNDN